MAFVEGVCIGNHCEKFINVAGESRPYMLPYTGAKLQQVTVKLCTKFCMVHILLAVYRYVAGRVLELGE